uniref:aldehyde dehydrogenase (NAD(+)) n=1 Tax=Clastoptera arizonana TaxID=38151 RepID=A0A1B6DQU2_9HEMI
MANRHPEIKYTKLFINNEFVEAKSGKKFGVLNPTTGEKIIDVSEGDKADVDIAVTAAKAAFQRGSPWRNLDASKRGKLLQKLAELMLRDVAQLASILTLENGKPFMFAQFEIMMAAESLNYYAGWCDKIVGKTIPTGWETTLYLKNIRFDL